MDDVGRDDEGIWEEKEERLLEARKKKRRVLFVLFGLFAAFAAFSQSQRVLFRVLT